MSTSSQIAERATCRTVILLRQSEKLRLDRLAAREKVSSAELIRRSLKSYAAGPANAEEERTVETALALVSSAIAEANDSLARTIAKLDRLHRALAKRALP